MLTPALCSSERSCPVVAVFTFVNDEPADVVKLKAGDRIRVGSVVFNFESDVRPGTETIFHQTEQEFTAGKGYSTILREIVNDMGQPIQLSEQKPKTERFKKPATGK